MVQVLVSASRGRFEKHTARARRTLRGALTRLRKHRAACEVFFITDAEMRRLSRITRGKNRPTNVLSFPAGDFPRPDLPRGCRHLGELYLAPDLIARRSESLPALLVHGLLHLLGYTHERARDRIRMERKEQELLKLVNGKR